jgi:hypothetical protein
MIRPFWSATPYILAVVSGMTVVLVRLDEADVTLKGVGTRCVWRLASG